MTIEIKIPFSRAEQAEIKRKLSYLDFVAQRSLPTATDDENIMASFISMAALTGRIYTAELVSSVLTDADSKHPDASFVRAGYRLIARALQDDCVSGIIDESYILSLAASLSESQKNALKVSSALSDVVEWWLVQSQRGDWHPLVLAGAFLYEFMEEDTLDDFREEVMLMLSLILLHRCGCNWLLLYTPLRIMAQDRVAYNRALKSRIASSSPISSWMIYWVDCLYNAAVAATRTQAPTLSQLTPSRTSPLNLRQRRLLDFIGKNQPVRMADITQYMHKESVNTLKKDLLRLRELGFVVADGVQKGMRYFKS